MKDPADNPLTESEMIAIRVLAARMLKVDKHGNASPEDVDKALFSAAMTYMSLSNRIWCEPGQSVDLKGTNWNGKNATLRLFRRADGQYDVDFIE